MLYLDSLSEQFNNKISFREKRPGILQLIAPFYHEDGDMLDIFLEESPVDSSKVRISDYGMTLMHLSYDYDIDSPAKEKVFRKMVSENRLSETDGTIYYETSKENLYTSIFHFAQTVGKVSSMRQFKREMVKNLFYEMLKDYVMDKLVKYSPVAKYHPIAERDDLEVDFQLTSKHRPIYLFGVKDESKSRIVAISCLEFQKRKLPFTSVVVHENFDSLTKHDRTRITSAADKQFPSWEEFLQNIDAYLIRESM